jgi:hypothetical protein
MAFELTDTLNEIRIYDEKLGTTQSLFARDPSPREQLAYDRERISQKKSQTVNRIRQTRLKYGCLVLDHPQAALTPQDNGYGFRRDGLWVPLTADETEIPIDREAILGQYGRVYGQAWVAWIAELPPWKVLLLAKAPQHIERVASVVFEGAADWKQSLGEEAAEPGEEPEGN